LLSKNQYLRTLELYFGPAVRDVAEPFAWEGPTGEAFNATAAVNDTVGSVSAVLDIEAGAEAAGRAAVASRSNTALPLAALEPCTTDASPDANERADCYRRLALALGRLAFRLPLDPNQVDALIGIGIEAEASPEMGQQPFDSGIHQVISTILQSGSFLYSIETGDRTSADAMTPLLPHELATRLSLTLLGRAPDLDLLEAAAAGQLDTPAQVEAAARAMLATPEAEAAFWDYLSEWFLIDLLDEQYRPSFANFDPLRPQMYEEARRFAVNHVFGPSPLPFPQIYSNQQRFITQALADNIYTESPITLTSPDAEGWQLIDFNSHHNQRRAGILTLPAFLTVMATDLKTALIGRGKFIWERVMCGSLLLPEGNVVANFPSPDPSMNTTWRILMEQHASNPGCAGCHQYFDPAGLALEHFDQIGAYREVDEGGGGGNIDATATILHPNSGPSFGILDGLDYGKIIADPSFPNSGDFIDNTASCQMRELHEALLGVPMAGEYVGFEFQLDDNATLASLKSAAGFPQFMLTDFLAEFAASDYYRQVGPSL
jgi:hypothetical protein